LDLSNMVEDMLVAARADSGGVWISTEVVDVGRQIRDVLGAFAVGRGLRPEFTGDPGGALVDPIRFRQIIRNLVSNAYLFGGPSISISSARKSDLVVIEVCDNGPGPGDEVADIFGFYVHHSTDHSTRPGPIGIGLAVSRYLARLMDGDLIYRREGETTVFSLEVPAA
jgi:signal transduction histidine kinase